MTRLPTVALVASCWGAETGEEMFVTREVAGALAGVAEVHVLAASPRGGVEKADGALRVLPVAAAPPDPLRSRLMLAAFSADASRRLVGWQSASGTPIDSAAVPAAVQEQLCHLNGGALDAVMAPLRDLAPSAVVLAGYRQVASRIDLTALTAEFPTVLLPLAGADPQLDLAVYDTAFAGVDRFLTVTAFEHESVSCRRAVGSAARVALARPALRVNHAAASRGTPGLRGTSYVLVLAGAPDGASGAEAGVARYIASRFTRRAVVVVEGDRMLVAKHGERTSERRSPTRVDLWKLMAGAHATVDLGAPLLLGREALESMLLSTPVVVRAGSISSDHAERGNGGLWFTDPRELLGCLEALEDADTRAALSAGASSFAAESYGSTDRFVSEVRATVLGTGAGCPPGRD